MKGRLVSDIEHSVLCGVAQHQMYREIAESLGIDRREVRECAARLAARLGCATKLDLMAKAQDLGYGRRAASSLKDAAPPPTFSGLSGRQSAVLRVLLDSADATGAAPLSYREIAERAGLQDQSAVEQAVRRLALRGVIARTPHQPRSIRVLWAKLNPLHAVRVPA